MAEEQVTTKPDAIADETMKELVDAGVFYGRKTSKTHPRMKQFILSNRNGIEIINVEKTVEMLDAALKFLGDVVKRGGTVLVIATQPQASEAIDLAKEFGFPYVDLRWLGGTLTNHKVISGRIEYYKKLKSDSEKGLLEKYTKKERLKLQEELARLTETMSGLESYNGHADVLLVIDANMHMTAVREAKHRRIPVVALVNTDTDPNLVEYPVLANNKAKISVNWFLGKVREAVRAAKAAVPAKAAAEAKSE